MEEQNSQMTDTSYNLQTERAKELRIVIGQWIASADTKATALLAVSGALLAILSIVTSFSGSSTFDLFSKFLFVGFCVFDILSIAASATVLTPRTDRIKILKKSGYSSPMKESPTYFGDLALLNFSSFQKALLSSKDVLASDSIEQSYVLSIIAEGKMSWMRRSIYCLLIALLNLSVFVLYEGYLSSKSDPPSAQGGVERSRTDMAGVK